MSLKNYWPSGLAIFALSIILLVSPGESSLDLMGISYNLAKEKASTPPGLGNPKIHKLTETVYAITDLYHSAGKLAGVNAGIIFTSGSVIFIDSGMTVASGDFLWETARKKMKEKEKSYLILTHHHSDHVFGMRAMKERGARVIAHKIVKAEFIEFDGERYKRFLVKRAGWSTEKGDLIFGDVLLSEPDQLIEQDAILNIDGEELHLVFTPGHTADSISVYNPKSKTLFAGDTIYEGMRLTTRFGGPKEWKLWISHLERLKQLEINTIIPGHGKLCSKKEIDRNIAYLKELLK
ncbi:MAG: MBL fold metallo-hydrolase [Candidatus Aminicenantes bacterium]|nr:MBL fold metallo-hydrolase [Candidatus Aminicenantes bacterium]